MKSVIIALLAQPCYGCLLDSVERHLPELYRPAKDLEPKAQEAGDP